MEGWHRGEEKVKKIWKEHFEDVYNIDTWEEVAVHMCDFDIYIYINVTIKSMGSSDVVVLKM